MIIKLILLLFYGPILQTEKTDYDPSRDKPYCVTLPEIQEQQERYRETTQGLCKDE